MGVRVRDCKPHRHAVEEAFFLGQEEVIADAKHQFIGARRKVRPG